MKYFSVILAVLCATACSIPEKKETSGKTIIEKSINKHDPSGNWESVHLRIHIQEPRVSNPHRYSVLKLNNNNGAFELVRNRDEHIVQYITDPKGSSKVLLDGDEEIDSSLVKKYGLDPTVNMRYKSFYHFMYGIPMTLNDKTVKSFGSATTAFFNNQESYKVEVELSETLISANWNLYISSKDYRLLGVEMVFPEDSTKGERIYFEHDFEYDDLIIPRVRHWHNYHDNQYMGSDIILKDSEERENDIK